MMTALPVLFSQRSRKYDQLVRKLEISRPKMLRCCIPHQDYHMMFFASSIHLGHILVVQGVQGKKYLYIYSYPSTYRKYPNLISNKRGVPLCELQSERFIPHMPGEGL